MSSTVDYGTTRDGLLQLRRRWDAGSDRRAVALIVHGYGEHSGRYDHVGDHLVAHGIEAIATDLRGFGESGGRRSFVDAFDPFLDDIEDQLIEVRSLAVPTILLGHSMGGLLAAAYAQTDRPQPDLVVLSAPALGVSAPAPLRLAAPLAGRLVPGLALPERIDPEVLSRDRSVGEAYVADPLVPNKMPVATGAFLIAAGAGVVERLDRIRVPVLTQHGGDDRLIPTPTSEPLAALGERIVYAGMRHEIYNEIDKEVPLGDLVDWIDQRLA